MNEIARWLGRLLTACLWIGLTACGGGGGDGASAGSPGTVIVAALGGTVVAGDATLRVPAGALRQDTTISVSTSAPSPALPDTSTVRGPVYDFGPDGTVFDIPATLTLPLTGTPAANERAVISYLDPATRQWVDLPSTTTGDSISAPLSHFTTFAQRFTGLDPGLPERTWFFDAFLGDGSGKTLSGSTQIFGTLNAIIDFGPAFDDQPIVQGSGADPLRPSDGIANGQIFSSESGGTFFVSAEAPGRIDLVPDSPIGNHALLKQRQSFVRESDNASLTFEVTDIVLQATDLNSTSLSFAECPTTPCPDLISATVAMYVEARTERKGIIYEASGVAQIRGDRRGWTLSTNRGQYFCPENPNSCHNPFFGTVQLWGDREVQHTADAEGTFVRLELRDALPFSIDLANVDIRETVTLEIFAAALTRDRRAGSDRHSSAYAYLRDPRTLGGTRLVSTGLRPTSRHVPALPVVNVRPPAPCVAGGEPAGTLQFSAASYSLPEWAEGEQAGIRVTRTGGSRGAVSATFSTRDATAIAGADYVPVQMTVSFADGDTTPKILGVPVVHDRIAEADKALELTLSEPGGCATLGTASSALLVIVDDDRPARTSFSVGGTVAGLTGSGLVLTQGGVDLPIATNGAFVFAQQVGSGLPYDVRVRTQPTSPAQVCAVSNGSGTMGNADVGDVLVQCATPAPTSGLDATFGSGGKVTTPATGTANAVAVFPDGRIVTAGGPFTLTRHLINGSPDPGFGSGGKVTTAFGAGTGSANDVAIQPDGRIVVAGSARARAGFSTDDNFAVRRYLADGSLDASFGSGGVVDTDFAAGADVATSVALQADGRIVVAGLARIGAGNDFAVARYNADGTPDTSFGTGGKVTTDIAGGSEGAPSLALQPDGKIVIAGRFGSGNTTSGAAVVRYNSDGSPDTGFGVGGKVTITGSVTADAMALQPDGRILVAGSVDAGTSNSAFAVMRLLADGSVDAGFGTATLRFFNGGNGSIGRNVAVQADGRIVLVGEAASGGSSTFDMAVARFDANGRLDATFGTGGSVVVDFFANFDGAADLAIQADGKIVVAGSARNGIATEFALMRVNP